MVLSFRVSELQLLLGLTSQSRCGRKTELMQRALALVERGVSVPVQLKIKELYQRFTPRPAGHISQNIVSPPVASNRTLGLSQQHSTMPAANTLGATLNCGSSNSVRSSTNSQVHRGLNELLVHQQRSQIPVHPDVKFKHLPFYELLGEIMKPTSLVPRSPAKQQEARISFCLSEQQVREIALSRIPIDPHSSSGAQPDFSVQIQLRFCVLDTTSRQTDTFPSNISVKINSMMAQLPMPIPTNKPGVEPKRPGRPVDITRICRLNASSANSMVITFNADETKNHCVAIYLVRKLDSNILLQRLKRAGVQKVEHTKSLVREKLSLDQDSDLATTSMRVSLLCPLGKMRMSLPCRASTCNHLQCFDGPMFIQMNEKKPTWICPVCDRPADFNRLIIDGLFMEILRSSVDSTEVELSRDGQWRVTQTDDSDDDSPCNSPAPQPRGGGATSTAASAASRAPQLQRPSSHNSAAAAATAASTSWATQLQRPYSHNSTAAAAATAERRSSVDTTPAVNGGPAPGGPAAGGGGGDCIDLTETDDEGIEPGTSASSNSRCASVSNHTPPPPPLLCAPLKVPPRTPPGSSAGSPMVYDLSPLNIPMPTPPPLTAGSRKRKRSLSPRRDDSSPPVLSPPVPPMAHQSSYSSLSKSSSNSSHLQPSYAHSGSSHAPLAPFSSAMAQYYGSSLGGLGLGGGFDGLLQQPDLMDFLALMSSVTGDYSSGSASIPGLMPPFNMPSSALDYLYQAHAAAAAADIERLASGKRSPTASR